MSEKRGVDHGKLTELAAMRLMEHFDSVLIIATHQERGGTTVSFSSHGNRLACYGSAMRWVNAFESGELESEDGR